jgi:pyrimidine-nucleoside phosphorylase
MNQPLGMAVGNALELREAMETLHGKGPQDFREHCYVVASHMLALGGKANNLRTARKSVEDAIASGKAWDKFLELVKAQGGDVRFAVNPDLLPRAGLIEDVRATRNGYISGIHAREVGETAVELGAGRAKKGDVIDLAVGIIVHQKVGNKVKKGDVLFAIHANDREKLAQARKRLLSALTWDDETCPPLPLFYGVIK